MPPLVFTSSTKKPMFPLVFTSTIGHPARKRGRKQASTASTTQQPINTWFQSQTSPQTTAEQRRKRMEPHIRKACVKLVYDTLFPDCDTKMQSGVLDDIAQEIAYLVKIGVTLDAREQERLLAEYGDSTIHEMDQAERAAHASAKNLDSTSEDDDDLDNDAAASDLREFVVSDDHLSSDEGCDAPKQLDYDSDTPPQVKKPRKQTQRKSRVRRTIQVEEDSEDEGDDEPARFTTPTDNNTSEHSENELDEVGTNIDTID